MATFTADYNDTISTLSEWAIRDSIRELKSRDRLTIALREALRNGADINDLSNISGLTITDIRRRINGSLLILSELELLAG